MARKIKTSVKVSDKTKTPVSYKRSDPRTLKCGCGTPVFNVSPNADKVTCTCCVAKKLKPGIVFIERGTKKIKK